MAERYLIETSGVDGYLLEDGGGVLILDEPFPEWLTVETGDPKTAETTVVGY